MNASNVKEEVLEVLSNQKISLHSSESSCGVDILDETKDCCGTNTQKDKSDDPRKQLEITFCKRVHLFI